MLFLLFFVSCWFHAIHIDRVILSTDTNPNYIQFWPIVAQAWQELVGIRPTLILVAPRSVCVDTTYGDVIRFEPLEDLPTGYQAQVIRLFAPTLFPDDMCMISDIDMLPLRKDFFDHSLDKGREDAFMPFWRYDNEERYMMTYVAAKGKTFGELFNITWQETPQRLYEWEKEEWGWHTDEKMMVQCITNWHAAAQRFMYLDHVKYKRIDRADWHVNDPIKLKNDGFFDADLPRSYVKHKQQIDELVHDLGLASRIDILEPLVCDRKVIQKKYSANELEASQQDIAHLIRVSDTIEIIDTNQSLSQFLNKSPQFIHFLKATFQASDYSLLRKLNHVFKFHQIALFQFEAADSLTVKELLHMLSEHHYVLFKLTPHGLMHVVSQSDLKNCYSQSKYLACAPQYARGWSSLKK